MNYFELFELNYSLHIDSSILRKKYIALSKKYHPDFNLNENGEVNNEVLEMSAKINTAFNTLNNQELLIQYILKDQGRIVEGKNYQLPNSFLMDMMETNEAIMEAETDAERNYMINNVEMQQKLMLLEIQDLIEMEFLECSEANISRLEFYYYKNKYINRLLKKEEENEM